jgi:MFS family permease
LCGHYWGISIARKEDLMKHVFFGWFIVAAAVILAIYNSAVFVYGLTAFMTPIAATFGWSYAQISFASSIRGMQAGTLDPVVGVAADRWPAKRLMFIGMCLYILGIIVISQAANLAVFYVGFLVMGLGSTITITIIPPTVIARWFKRNIGKASGILSLGVGLGGLFAPLVVKGIDAYGWQSFLVYLAFGALILGVPLSFVFRSRPEEHGLLPDGKTLVDVKGSSDYDFSTGVREAIKTRAFWCIGMALMLQMVSLHSVTIHLMPYLTSLGMERSRAAVAVTVLSIVSLAPRIIYGILADIFRSKYILALSQGLTAVGLFIFSEIVSSSFASVLLFIFTYGLGVGGAMPLRTTIIREYFGTRKFGTIYGLVAFFVIIGSVIGPPIAGWVFDTRGVYDPIWFIYGGLAMVGVILILIMPPASRKLSPVVS